MSSLWNNPAVEAAKKDMSPEELEKYRKMGEHMYGNLDNINNPNTLYEGPKLEEAAEYLGEAVKSGLHPSMLEDHEKAVLKEIQGDKWWENYGYVEADLTEIVTILKS